ncbi:NAD(P)-dependent oxidoreductase [Mesorhizobium sp. LHD-90]|uniref:NAD-dependent epimerase/dehydratase family protein n=1 Tax=Mesorhizobium sp. LHD-90 TaxID=3071414 RepID=UPI0027E109C7|nr:NAD(P)-dependent oxidoreductase [Mesorhizobium sp. LHD-90]MDQ6434294.1 NAD(P)-dependent oxidoreductase [Mesorhizobium sp. LHD-90]
MTETILLTGAAGLIGRAVHRMLRERGDRVIAIDRIGGQDIVASDLTEVHRLHELAASATAVVHCGAISGPMVARDNPYLIVSSNVVGTANILELARVRKMRRVVCCSSVSAYGNTPAGLDLVPEDVPLKPTSVYGASKAAGEHLLDGYAIQHGIDGVSIRPAWVYGPGRTTDCAIRTMILDAQAERATPFPFGRDFYRQYVHVDDVATALVLALDAEKLPRRSYTITGGSYVTLAEVARTVKAALPQADITMGAGPDPIDDVQARFDISAAERDLGYRPRISLLDGIRSYAQWLAARR